MRKAILTFIFLFVSYFSFGQVVSISADRENVFYLEIANPFTIAVENNSCATLILKTDNGKIEGSNCKYLYTPDATGKSTISVFIKKNNKLKLLSKSIFRVKRLLDMPNIAFKIGPCGNDCVINKRVLEAQEFVRAELVNTDINARVLVDSFAVYIYSKDTCIIKQNIGNKISDEIKIELHSIENNDLVIFRNIYVTLPDKTSRKIESAVLFIKE